MKKISIANWHELQDRTPTPALVADVDWSLSAMTIPSACCTDAALIVVR